MNQVPTPGQTEEHEAAIFGLLTLMDERLCCVDHPVDLHPDYVSGLRPLGPMGTAASGSSRLLSFTEQDIIEDLGKGLTTDEIIARRAGWSDEGPQVLTGQSELIRGLITVIECRWNRYLKHFTPNGMPGRPRALTPKAILLVVRLLCRTKPREFGYDELEWTTRTLLDALRRAENIVASDDTLRRALHLLKIQWDGNRFISDHLLTTVRERANEPPTPVDLARCYLYAEWADRVCRALVGPRAKR